LSFGGAALAWRGAKGGLAVAHDFAIGGAAIAPHANDDAAREYFEISSLFDTAERAARSLSQISGHWVYPLVLTACIVALVAVARRIAYRPRAD
jgi:phage-related tail fiber protein